MSESAQANTQNPASEPVPPTAPTPESSASEAKGIDPVVADLVAQVAAAKKDAADNYDRYVRLAADMENLRRRTVREKDELRQYAAGRVLEDLLPVLDNFGFGLLAAKAPNADLKTLVGGISMVQDQLRKALETHGLKEINPLAAEFDPNLHESLSTQPSAEIAEGKVAQVVRIGYSLNGRLLRPASVVLSSGPATV
jgi:molecular chaperone GrpE